MLAIWSKTARSVSFDIKCKLPTGRRLFICVGSKPGFLRIGITRASFHSSEKWPLDSERFIIREITGNSTSRQPTTRVQRTGLLNGLTDKRRDVVR